MFFVICENLTVRSELISLLKKNDVLAVFHYLSLHKSDFYKDKHEGKPLENSDNFEDCLLRLPLYYELTNEQLKHITDVINTFR
jgi:dTDP-4-amino-4,6-dideoxygalactose transaminase